MKFRQYGYTERKIKVRQMTMAEIALAIAQEVIGLSKEKTEIRVIDCYKAEADIFDTLSDFLTYHWNAKVEVNVYGWALMHDERTNTDFFKVIISDEVEL